MKDLNDIKQDMSVLYDEVKQGQTELKTASELANIAGKYLKAHQLELAERIFMSGIARKAPELPENVHTIDARDAARLAIEAN